LGFVIGYSKSDKKRGQMTSISLTHAVARAVAPEKNDETLAQEAVNGSFEAFEALVERYSRPLFNYIYHLVADGDEANDILQQVLCKAYAGLPKLSTYQAIKPWLYKIARNQSLDCLRQRRQKHRPTTFANLARQYGLSPNETVNQLEEIHDPNARPDEIAEQNDLQRLLKTAMGQLPQRYREVVELRYSSEMSFAEIGKTLGIPENTAKTFFQRSKGILKDYLKDRL
jgi:RNA polymerase sigma factor (sigma-70 family)